MNLLLIGFLLGNRWAMPSSDGQITAINSSSESVIADSTTEKACALCGQVRKLCDSHIVPEFVYKPLYDEKHRVLIFGSPRELAQSKIGSKIKSIQKGLREKLLCQECETNLSKYEAYASKAFRGKMGVKVESCDRKIAVSGLDYARFKLFLLSILWRAGVSGHNAFGNVCLGTHAEKIAQMIREGNPGQTLDYPIVCRALTFMGVPMVDLILSPQMVWSDPNGDRTRVCHFLFGGFEWLFYTESHTPFKIRFLAQHKFILNESGEMIIIRERFEETSTFRYMIP